MAKFGNWLDDFNDREQRLIFNSVDYARRDPAGLPGHNLMVIIEKMCTLLDSRDTKQDIPKQPEAELS